MITVLKESNFKDNFIGGKLSEFEDKYYPKNDEAEEEYWEKVEERTDTIDSYLMSFSDCYIKYAPDAYEKFSFIQGIDPSWDLWDKLAIKDGVDLVDHGEYLEAIAYYNRNEDHVYLYPISQEKADELEELIDEGEFDESDIIDNEIAQYAYDGASVEDVLLSWN